MAEKRKHRATTRRRHESYILRTKPVFLWRQESEDNSVSSSLLSSVSNGDTDSARRRSEPPPSTRAPLLPVDITFLRKHCFIVADSEAHHLAIYDLTRDQPQVGVLASGRVWPNSVARTRDGNGVVVTDRKDNMIKVLDAERGAVLLGIETPYEDEGEEETPFHPMGVAVNSRGEIIVTDTGKHVVHIYTPQGELRKTFGSKGRDTLQQLCLPFYCAVDSRDRILVSDNMNYCVKVFDANGNFESQIGSGKLWGQKHFQCPYGVCTDPDDNILVADHDTHRIILIEHDGGGGGGGRGGGGGGGAVGGGGSGLGLPSLGGESGSRDVMNKMNQCRFPMGVAVGPCGTLAYTEANKDHNVRDIKAYNLYDLETHV